MRNSSKYRITTKPKIYLCSKTKNMKNLPIALAFAIIFVLPTKIFAWGKTGHNLVAEVAFTYLSESTKAKVLAHLNGFSIEDAANWMDNIKRDKSCDYMKPWHYVNFDKEDYVNEYCQENVIAELCNAINNLSNRSLGDAKINENLLVLFHLIGDIHQPLHVGYGADKGGNDVQLFFNNKGTNLHSFFDSGIIEYKKINLQDVLDSCVLTDNEKNKIQNSDAVEWATESRSYLTEIYAIDPKNIDEAYIETNAKIIKKQILYAGIRLAKILNDVFENQNEYSSGVNLEKTQLFDKTRNRIVPIAIYTSVQVNKFKNPKIILINHGYGANHGGDYLKYSYIADYFASKGYFVVSIQHELPTDDEIPKDGIPQIVRRPFWERGVKNIVFVIDHLKSKYKTLDFKNITALGHSNGGDMVMLLAEKHPNLVQNIISLDNRRMMIPRTNYPKMYSLRSSDQVADEGVLPSLEDCKKFDITIQKSENIKHNDMSNGGSETQKLEIIKWISGCLQ